MLQYTVIIPVYNAEKYLKKCVDSILEQNPRNIEIILVDDGSTDSSISICRLYEEKYSFIRVLRQNNQGVSAARNTGLKNASGKWIIFVDADDYILPGFFNEIDLLLEKCCCADSFIFSGNAVDQYTEVSLGDDKEQFILALLGCKCSKAIFNHMPYLKSVWSKIYSREIIMRKHIKFPEKLVMGEDLIFNIHYFMNSRSCICLPGIKYYYRPNTCSASKGYNPKIPACDPVFQDELLKIAQIYHLETVEDKGCTFTALCGIFIACTSCFFRYPISMFKQYKKDLLAFIQFPVYKCSLNKINMVPELSFKKKIILYLLKHHMLTAAYLLWNIQKFLPV